MNEHEYRRLRESRQRLGPLPLGEAGGRSLGRGALPSPLATIVARAVRTTKRRQKAVVAWQRVAQPEWLAATAVETLDGDTLVVAVSGPALCYELRRCSAVLERALAGLMPGLRHVRFVARGLEPGGEA